MIGTALGSEERRGRHMNHRVRVKGKIKSLVAAAVICLFPAMIFAPVTNAQEKSATTAAGPKANQNQQHSGGTPSKDDEEKIPEFDFVASSDYRGSSLIVPLFRGLNFEGHYIGVRAEPEENGEESAGAPSGIIDTGTINGSYRFRLGEGIALFPGFGIYFGEDQRTSPAITFRWEIEKGRIFSQGLFIQSLLQSEEFGRPSIWDGNHVSVRLSRFEFGPSWERIHTRAENEWKGGGRAAFRLLRNVSVVFFVLAPNTEYRGGIIVHPER
jgi:hypothetical protein